MTVGGIPHEAVGVSVAVLLYSSFCLTLSTLLTCLLVKFGERWSYVTIFSGFTAFSTLASICQQLHYATSWVIIKQAQFDKAVASLSRPGLALGGSAQIVDQVLFFIQFYCYNVMSLNILFWTIALFTGARGISINWLREWYARAGPISKVFAVLFPGLLVGLLNVNAVLGSTVTFVIVAYASMFSSLTVGSILLILILYKYVKTRRLLAGYGHRGRWWASGSSKERSERDIGAVGTVESEMTSSTRRSIYDRALVTRFTIAFLILALFEVAIIIFTLVQASSSATIAASGQPDLSTAGTIVDLVLFIPGVTASLVAFLVFGTTKSWREYRNLVVGGCGIRQKIIERRARREEEGPGLEFERLPSLNTTRSEEDRKKGEEAENRVRMFSREINNHLDGSPYARSESAGRVLQFHRPSPVAARGALAPPSTSGTSGTIEVGPVVDQEDPVVRYEKARDEYNREHPMQYPRTFVIERLPTRNKATI